MISAKRICAMAAAFMLTVSAFSGYAAEELTEQEQTPVYEETEPSEPPLSLDDAVKELEEQEQQEQQEATEPEQTGEQTQSYTQSYENDTASQQPASQQQTTPDYSDSVQSDSFNVTPYAEKLREISAEQRKLDEQLKQTEEKMEESEERDKLLMEYAASVQENIDVLNSYLTSLEININDNKLKLENKQREIDEGIEAFKGRLRALYLSGGDDSYISVLLSSKDFFDIMMRLELVKRVARHDDGFIDKLTEARDELLVIEKRLDERQKEYDEQLETLNSLQRMYDALIAQNKGLQLLLAAEKKAIEEKNQAYIDERTKFEESLSGLLSSSYGNSAGDTERIAAEAEARSALNVIREAVRERESAGTIGENECRYVFKWPVPGYYYISSGVGARWGRYHNGIDIPGPKGTEVLAAESGRVVRIYTSCPHDYGKEESCGCGGGYGNHILIDHGNGFMTLYGHLSSVDVELGDTVTQGSHIGKMGSTGYSTGDHLHFEIRYNGKYLNPAAFVTIDV